MNIFAEVLAPHAADLAACRRRAWWPQPRSPRPRRRSPSAARYTAVSAASCGSSCWKSSAAYARSAASAETLRTRPDELALRPTSSRAPPISDPFTDSPAVLFPSRAPQEPRLFRVARNHLEPRAHERSYRRVPLRFPSIIFVRRDAAAASNDVLVQPQAVGAAYAGRDAPLARLGHDVFAVAMSLWCSRTRGTRAPPRHRRCGSSP